MRRSSLWCLALAVCALPAQAQQTETLLRLTVRPMAAPKPALRYLLLPELKEMQPGNPIPNYLRCLMDQDFANDREALGRFALRNADWAARLDKPDWQILMKLKTDGVNLLLPDVQKLRTLANALRERFHEEVTQQRFDDAIRTAKTMFALSRHMGEHPTLIGDLVGIAIANVAIAPLEEMLEQPGCPNLYWALTNLPSPFIPLDKGMEGERTLIQAELGELTDTAPLTTGQLTQLMAKIDKLRSFDDNPPKKGDTTRVWIDARIKDKAKFQAARQRLIEYGVPEERLATFPLEQLILLDEKLAFETRRDEVMKLVHLPHAQVEAFLRTNKPSKERSLLEIFVPNMLKVHRAQGRLDQRIALLRHIEALRIYAAEHDGKLPEKLADVTVPLPDDPFTGKPFQYRLEGTTAHLRGSPPPGEESNASFNIHYEIVMQK